MPRTKYQTELPAIHLEEDDLADLEQVLRGDKDGPAVEFKLHNGQFTYEYSTTDDILSDNTLPDFIQSFEITSDTDAGKIKITANEEENEIKFWISGEQEWVRRKKDHVEEFFKHRGDEIRTAIQNHLHTALASIGVITGVGANYTDYGPLVGDALLGDVFLLGIAGLFAGALITSVINYLHPYALVRLSNKQLRPYLWRILRWATIIAALLTILGMGNRLFSV